MATTYKKPSITAQGSTLMDTHFRGDADTYAALEAHKTVKIKSGDGEILVPFHAVRGYQSVVSATDATKEDAYCE